MSAECSATSTRNGSARSGEAPNTGVFARGCGPNMIRPRSAADAPSTVTASERRRRHHLQLAIELHRHRSPPTQHDRQRTQRIDESGANGGIRRGEQHAHGGPNRRTSTTAKPNVPQVVTHESPPALFTIAY